MNGVLVSLLSVASVVLNDDLLIWLFKSSGWTSGGLTAYRLSSRRVPGLSSVVIFRPVLGNALSSVNSSPVPHLANLLTS